MKIARFLLMAALLTASGLNALAENSGTDPYRPEFHYTASEGWLNDPNGLVYVDGTWHLFYQYSKEIPEDKQIKCWGHAVSTDLLHWQELPIAIKPKFKHDEIFSGSAVIDRKNTAGFGKNAFIAVYTSIRRGECLAWSKDGGKTFKDYNNNPVLFHGGNFKDIPKTPNYWYGSRDPKVFWYAPNHEWVMIVYEQYVPVKRTKDDAAFAIYTSKNLTDWTFQSKLPGWYECPELFELPVNGNKLNNKWVVMGASGFYAIGSFDGKSFIPDQFEGSVDRPVSHRRYILEPYKYAGMRGNIYAPQTWNDAPNGRRVMIAWVRYYPPPKATFSQAMSLPLALSLRTTEDGIRMFFNPVKEVKKLEKEVLFRKSNIVLKDGKNLLAKVPGGKVRIKCTFKNIDAKCIYFLVNGLKVNYEFLTNELANEKMLPVNGKIQLDIIADQGVTEIFANKGRIYKAFPHYIAPDKKSLSLVAEAGNVKIEKIKVIRMGLNKK
ncbi:glycoside hydrolase family 32 protein [Lentisphaerota bacterium ZTH]|nr:glycoside hydrolase family 32 protein [Lentisphaerota bacterium]WET07184.1 glycoside hydrolase family 32 protein [Lentisphaerota bacterium ZTH]